MVRTPNSTHETKPEGEERAPAGPSWDELHAIAETQQGVFSAEQAAEAGFSSQLLNKHLHGGTLERVQRGIYRLVRFPSAERAREELVVAWLWSGRVGVFSHETALRLHGLSDAFPARLHLTVPAAWQKRRVRPPEIVSLAWADLDPSDIGWVGSVPVTTPGRSIVDVAAAHGDASLVDAAIRQALRRDLASLPELAPAVVWLAGANAFDSPRPEELTERDGTWLVQVVSGVPAAPLGSDWRVAAEGLAQRHGARLHAARFSRESRRLSLELAWPVDGGPGAPARSVVRADAAKVFGWQ